MLSTLKATLKEVRGQLNWRKEHHVRLVFHAFKPLKDREIKAVKQLMESLGEYKVDYAFLHVVEDHSHILFDECQKGVPDFETGRVKGLMAPNRSTYFRLSRHELLISLTGARDIKRPQDGIPRPILLKLHRDSNFEDMTYLAKQVYTFSCHSWRSFFPSPLPVTILYSQLIARLLGQLTNVPNWDPDVMLGQIGRTRWFL